MGRVILKDVSILVDGMDDWIDLGACEPDGIQEGVGFIQIHLRGGNVEYFKTETVKRIKLKEKN